MIVNFVDEFYAKGNRTVPILRVWPLSLSTRQRQNDKKRSAMNSRQVYDCSCFCITAAAIGLHATTDAMAVSTVTHPPSASSPRWSMQTSTARSEFGAEFVFAMLAVTGA